MGVCVSNGLFSLFPCKVLPTLTISWFPKLVFFGSIIFLLHSTSKPLHLLLLHSMSSPGWFLLVLQAQVRGYQLREAFLHPHGDPSKHYILILFMKQITTCNHPVHSFNWFILAFIHSAHCTRAETCWLGLHLSPST